MPTAKAGIVETSATLRAGTPYVFIREKHVFDNRGKKRYNFETANGRNLNFRNYMGHI